MENQSTAIERTNDNRAVVRHQPAHEASRAVAPPVDIFENNDEILILADFAGVEREALHVRLDASELTIEGHSDGTTLRRAFQVTNTIDPERISAELSAGVLRVRLAKREQAKPRRIEVRPG
jgi:HSP20 family molecular chaperone IbpA